MSKIRINDLARELEVKSKVNSRCAAGSRSHREEDPFQFLEEHEADKGAGPSPRRQRSPELPAKSSRPSRPEGDEIKTKIDLSNISKPGDVLKRHYQQAASARHSGGSAGGYSATA